MIRLISRTPAYLKRMLLKHGCLQVLLDYLQDPSASSSSASIISTDDSGEEELLYAKAVMCLHDLCNMLNVYHPLMEVRRQHSIGMLDQAVADIGMML